MCKSDEVITVIDKWVSVRHHREQSITQLEKLLQLQRTPRGAPESSVDAPPHDHHRGQQTNHRACCSGRGGVTQVRVAALEGEAGHLED